MQRPEAIKVGDLVHFNGTYQYGIVLAIKNAEAFQPEEKIHDIKVLWTSGEEFWCLDFTLKAV